MHTWRTGTPSARAPGTNGCEDLGEAALRRWPLRSRAVSGRVMSTNMARRRMNSGSASDRMYDGIAL
jgi:hypothetical protein